MADNENDETQIDIDPVDSTLKNAIMIRDFSAEYGKFNDQKVVDETRESCEAVSKRDDITQLEEMLTGQALALDAMFTHMVHRAKCNFDNSHLKAGDAYFKLGLKAQSQCKATVVAIANIKQPKQTLFAKQANIAQQQIISNNSEKKIDNQKRTEQIGVVEHATMDAINQRETTPANNEGSAVVEINRRKNGRG